MGGLMRGYAQNNGNKGRPYGLMLILAFGAAIFGVMLLHKLRERRIFTLLIQEKDRDLISLQLLLQQERDYVEEAKRKNEVMRAKIQTLQTQNMELDGRVLGLQSTISSLKDEQRMIESALEEKQNEIKLLRDREIGLNIENPPVNESVNEKDETELKHGGELPVVQVRSVSLDDPSNLPVNLIDQASVEKQETEVGGGSEKDNVGLREPTDFGQNKTSKGNSDAGGDEYATKGYGGTSTENEDKRENEVEISDKRDKIGEQYQNVGNSEEGVGQGSEVGDNTIDESQNGKGFVVLVKTNNENATQEIVNDGGDFRTLINEDGERKVIEEKESGTTTSLEMGKLSNSQGGDGHDLRVNSEGGMKLEVRDSHQGEGYRERGNHDRRRKGKGKRSRIIAKNRVFGRKRNSEEGGFKDMNGRRAFEDSMESERSKTIDDGKTGEQAALQYDNIAIKSVDEPVQEDVKSIIHNKVQQGGSLKNNPLQFEHGEEKPSLKTETSENDGGKNEDRPTEIANDEVSYRVKLPKSEGTEGAEAMNLKDEHTNLTDQGKNVQEIGTANETIEKPHSSTDEKPIAVVENEASGTSSDHKEQKPEDAKQSKQQDTIIEEQAERRDNADRVYSDSEETKTADKTEEPDRREVKDVEEPESKTVTSTEFTSQLEEDQERKEKMDEQEF